MTSEGERGLPAGVEWGPTDRGSVLCDADGAVRAPVAPIRIAVGAPDPLGLGVGEHDAPGGEVPCSCGAWHREAVAEPAPLPCPDRKRRECFAGVRQCDAAKRAESEPAPLPACGSWEDELHHRADDLERYVGLGEHASVDDAVATLRAAAEVMGRRAEPAPREPSAPPDAAELARLLQGLPADVAHLRERAHYTDQLARVLDACELLLGERERIHSALRPYHTPTRDEGSYERTLARVLAELDRLRADDGARLRAIVAKNRELTDALGAAEEERDALRARVAELEATPPPHTVAALLLKVESYTDEVRDRRDNAVDRMAEVRQMGALKSIHDVTALITATLGAPSALDGVVAEVLARAKGFADQRYPGAWLDLARETADAQDGNHRENAIECAGLCLRAVLACDAPATKEPG